MAKALTNSILISIPDLKVRATDFQTITKKMTYILKNTNPKKILTA